MLDVAESVEAVASEPVALDAVARADDLATTDDPAAAPGTIDDTPSELVAAVGEAPVDETATVELAAAATSAPVEDVAVAAPRETTPPVADGAQTIEDKAGFQAQRTADLLRRFRPGQNIDAELAAYEAAQSVGPGGAETPAVEPSVDAVAVDAAQDETTPAESIAAEAAQPVDAPVASKPAPLPTLTWRSAAAPVEPAGVAPEPVVADGAEAEPVAEAEPEPVAAEVEPEPLAAEVAVEAEPVAAEPEPVAVEVEPEPVAAELAVAAEPVFDEAEPVAAEAAPVVAEPEPIAASAEAVAELAADPEPTPEPVAPELAAAAAAPVAPEVPAEPGPVAPPARDDRILQPTWQIFAPDASPAVGPLDGTVPPVAPVQPPAAASGAPQWPVRPDQVESPAMALLAKRAGGEPSEGLWAASAQEVMARPAGAPAPTGVQPCSSCGLSLSATARFCRRCGTRQG